jgi:hypothetical protein
MRSLQDADVIGLHRWPDWPRAPIFLSQSLGYWPSRETILAQAGLTAIYVLGAIYAFVIRPRRQRTTNTPTASAPTTGTPSHPAIAEVRN